MEWEFSMLVVFKRTLNQTWQDICETQLNQLLYVVKVMWSHSFHAMNFPEIGYKDSFGVPDINWDRETWQWKG